MLAEIWRGRQGIRELTEKLRDSEFRWPVSSWHEKDGQQRHGWKILWRIHRLD